MMQFLSNYWMLFLIFFILLLILVLEYMMSQEKKRINKIDQKYEKEIEKLDLERKTIGNYNNAQENNYNNDMPKQSFDKQTKEELDYNSLDIKSNSKDKITKVDMDFDEFEEELSKLDSEFNKVVSKKNILNEDLIASIDEMRIEPLSSSKQEQNDEEIVLPEIKLD